MQKQNETPIEQKPGLVISYFGNSVAVEALDGQVFQCHLRRNQELPVVGDQVIWSPGIGDGSQAGVILSIKPRKTVLLRGDKRGQMKPLAANVDNLLIVMAPSPIFSTYLVDRYLVAAALLKIKPVIVLHKEDLLNEAAHKEAEKQLDSYAKISYPIIFSSIYHKPALAHLSDILKGHTSVLVGPSGVGKSSIIAALGSREPIRIGDVSAKGSGKHTTTATRLYRLPGGGNLIDSPGVREFNLWPITKAQVLAGFPEFVPYLGTCRFRDCQHVAEPGCSVQKAVTDDKISAQRYQSYLTLMKQAMK